MPDTPFFAPPISFGPPLLPFDSAADDKPYNHTVPFSAQKEYQELKRQYDELREQVKKLEARVDAIQFNSRTKSLGSVKATGSIDP